MRKLVLGLCLGVIVASAAGWVGYRLWVFEQLKPVRAGIGLLKEGDYQGALRALRPFAERGNATAQRALGQMYAEGLGLPVDDVSAAIWFRRAECGCSEPGRAEFGTGLDFLRAKRPDRDAALRWIVRAAEAGHAGAQHLLADREMLAEKGLVVDSKTSEYWNTVVRAE